MFLAELIISKENIENKISEIKEYLLVTAGDEENEDSSKIDDAVNELFSLLDQRQKKEILIAHVKRTSEIRIGKSSVTLGDAVKLRDTIKRKMNILVDLIAECKFNKNSLFDVRKLMEDKNKLVDEYTILDNAIRSGSWHIKVGD